MVRRSPVTGLTIISGFAEVKKSSFGVEELRLVMNNYSQERGTVRLIFSSSIVGLLARI